MTTLRQSCEVSSTFDLSTLVTFLRRLRARWNAMRDTRSISGRV